MWCHLCTQDYPDFEDFRIHILEKHRNASNFCKESSDSESVHEDAETSEVDDENAALNNNCYELDHNTDTEFKWDSSMDGNDALNTFSGQYREISTEIKSDDSMDTDDNIVPGEYSNSSHTIATKNKSNVSKAALNDLHKKYKGIDTENKSDESMDEDDNTVPEKYNISGQTIATKNKNINMAILNNLSGKSYDNEVETSVKKNTVLKKRRQRCNTENKSSIKATAINKSPKKLKAPSILKKRGRKKQIKVSFNKKALPKRRMPAFSHQKDIPEDTDGHSENSFNGDNKVNPQSVSNNFINPASMMPVNNYPQPISNNNPVYIVNPYGTQGMNNYVLGNQAVQPPVYVVNTVAAKPTTSNTPKCFDFNSENILNWLTKHKEFCKNMEYPLAPSLFDRVKTVHKGIFDRYCTASISEETTAVLKVYEELDCMIHKHINSINNALSVL